MNPRSLSTLSILALAMLSAGVPLSIAGDAPKPAETAAVAPDCDAIWKLPFGERLKALRANPECRRPVVVDNESMGASNDSLPPKVFESDIRLKRDIVPLGTANGYSVYGFRYLDEDTEYVGVMAQDIVQRVPSAVSLTAAGYLQVNYTALGLHMVTLDQWHASPSSILQ